MVRFVIGHIDHIAHTTIHHPIEAIDTERSTSRK